MIWMRKIVRVTFVVLASVLGFKRMPGAFYARTQEILEDICRAYYDNGRKAVLVKRGLYLFIGDDMVIYNHHQNQSDRMDLVSARWARVGDISARERRLIGFTPGSSFSDEYYSDYGFLRYMQDYFGDSSLHYDSYVTLFECRESMQMRDDSRGILFETVKDTLEFRSNLWTPEMCIE